jgi:hypothetical protein
MSRKAESIVEIFIVAALLVTCDWFVAATWPTNNLGFVGSLVAALISAVIALGLFCRALQGFLTQEKGLKRWSAAKDNIETAGSTSQRNR